MEKLYKENKIINIGLVVNPIAGMGGSVGLKGTDDVANLAIELGAIPSSMDKCKKAFQKLIEDKDKIYIYTCSGNMGEDIIVEMGFNGEVVYNNRGNVSTDADTINACKVFVDYPIDIIVFAGGDGTARNICSAIGLDKTVIGIPTGVKMYSPVFAKTPERAGELLKLYINGKINDSVVSEVVDVDENLFRSGRVCTLTYGYLSILNSKKHIQNKKAPTALSEKQEQFLIAKYIVCNMEKDVYYLIGPGTTTKAIMDTLNLDDTLIGVDLIYNEKLIANDLNEKEILKYIYNDAKVKLIITPTGGQGYLIGRGNQQLSPKVLEIIGKENIIVIATKEKLMNLNGEPLIIDTCINQSNCISSEYIKIVTGYEEITVYKLES